LKRERIYIMRNEKMVMGELLVDLVTFTDMGNREFKDQFESFVKASITLTMANGEERTFEIGEILKAKFESFDEDGIAIEEVDQLSY
jgi:hypothetical protein